MSRSPAQEVRGRGAQIQPANRFEALHIEDDLEHMDHGDPAITESAAISTHYLPDETQSIVAENNSPDVGFRYSLNPYRGCAHGCVYCYARPTHEYLGMSAGLDFETKIMVKERAPELFRRFLARKNWRPEIIAFSGVTDCYQLAERRFGLTRGCLEVALEARQPVRVITKNAMLTRDLDLLHEMAAHRIIHASMSVTTLDAKLAHTMEPRTSPPASRLKAITALSAADVPIHVMVAPIIPGLNDSEIPAILQAVADAGAASASCTLLRLPLSVEPIFLDWLSRVLPSHKERIVSRIRGTRGGYLSQSKFGQRMRGEGAIADQIKQTFDVFAARHNLNKHLPPLDAGNFRRPGADARQMWLF